MKGESQKLLYSLKNLRAYFQSSNTDWTTNTTIVFAFFIALHVLMLFFHEPWRDELQPYSIAQQSSSLGQLFTNKRYEGHPMLWYVILFIITHFSDSVLLVEFVHLGISCIAIWLFLKFCPLKNIFKYLVVFGYFFLFEYTVMFRHYSSEVLLAFAFCSLMEKKSFLAASIILFLLLQTNIFCFFIGGSLWTIYIWHHWKLKSVKFWFANVVVLAGAIIAVLSTIPPPDTGFEPGWHFQWRSFVTVFPLVWNGFIPIPEYHIQFWNTNFLDHIFSPDMVLRFKRIGTVVFMLFCIYTLRSSVKALLFFLLSSSAIVAFLSFKFSGDVRHQGEVFLAFIIALWLREIFPDRAPLFHFFTFHRPHWLKPLEERIENNFLVLLLLIQIVAGASAYYYDLKYPFSNATTVADYIRKNKPGYYLIGQYDAAAAAVAVSLGYNIFYPSIHDEGLFVLWNTRRKMIPDDSLLTLVALKKQAYRHVLLIASSKLTNDSLLQHYGISLVKKFEPSIVADEQFFIYE